MDPYGIIGIKKGASYKEAKIAYLKRVKVLHPDRFDPQKQKSEWLEANEMLRQLNLAWKIVETEIPQEEQEKNEVTGDPSIQDSAQTSNPFGYCPNCGKPTAEFSKFCGVCGHSNPGKTILTPEQTSLSVTLATIYLLSFPILCFFIWASFRPIEQALLSGLRVFLFCIMPYILIRFPKFFVTGNSTGNWVIILGWFGNIGLIIQMFFF